MPHAIRPMLATPVAEPFDNPDWLFEMKWDGYRAVAEIRDGDVSLYSRNLLPLNEKFAPIVAALRECQFEAVFDGEIVVVDERGHPAFNSMWERADMDTRNGRGSSIPNGSPPRRCSASTGKASTRWRSITRFITCRPRSSSEYGKAAPKVLRVMLDLELEHSLLDLVKLRASQINGCAFCIDMHTKDARARGETEQRLYELDAWRETPFYSGRERAALAWTEAVTLVTDGHMPDEVYEEA